MIRIFKPILLICSVVILCINSSKCQEWEATGELPPTYRYEDVFFIDTARGWTASSSGEIYKTEDGGSTWDSVYTSDYYLRSIEFINDSVGFAGSLNGAFLRSADAGESWTEIQDSIPQLIDGICGLAHVGNTVFGVGIWSQPAYLIKSTDEGLTWTYTDMSTYASGLVDCHFINENVGFASGIIDHVGGVILKTTDGGVTWEQVFLSHGGVEYIWKMFFVNDLVAYGSVEAFHATTSIVKTSDGGDTWTQLIVSEKQMNDIQGIGFADELTGWVGPRDYPLLETRDGGETWEQLDVLPNINRFFRIQDRLFASGSQVYQYEDDISGTSNPTHLHAHEILSIHPNPFSDVLQMAIRLDTKTRVRLDLSSIDGRNVIQIHAGTLHSGVHHFTFDGKLIPEPGVYLLILRTNEGFMAKEVVKSDR